MKSSRIVREEAGQRQSRGQGNPLGSPRPFLDPGTQGSVEAASSEAVDSVKRILVPTDFSQSSARALSKALALARQFGASLTLLHVVDLNLHTPPTGPANAHKLKKHLWTEGRRQLDRIASKLARGDFRIETMMREGLVHEEIADAAKDCDLVVIGRHQRRFMGHLFSRHTVNALLNAVPQPVLVVHGP